METAESKVKKSKAEKLSEIYAEALSAAKKEPIDHVTIATSLAAFSAERSSPTMIGEKKTHEQHFHAIQLFDTLAQWGNYCDACQQALNNSLDDNGGSKNFESAKNTLNKLKQVKTYFSTQTLVPEDAKSTLDKLLLTINLNIIDKLIEKKNEIIEKLNDKELSTQQWNQISGLYQSVLNFIDAAFSKNEPFAQQKIVEEANRFVNVFDDMKYAPIKQEHQSKYNAMKLVTILCRWPENMSTIDRIHHKIASKSITHMVLGTSAPDPNDVTAAGKALTVLKEAFAAAQNFHFPDTDESSKLFLCKMLSCCSITALDTAKEHYADMLKQACAAANAPVTLQLEYALRKLDSASALPHVAKYDKRRQGLVTDAMNIITKLKNENTIPKNSLTSFFKWYDLRQQLITIATDFANGKPSTSENDFKKVISKLRICNKSETLGLGKGDDRQDFTFNFEYYCEYDQFLVNELKKWYAMTPSDNLDFSNDTHCIADKDVNLEQKANVLEKIIAEVNKLEYTEKPGSSYAFCGNIPDNYQIKYNNYWDWNNFGKHWVATLQKHLDNANNDRNFFETAIEILIYKLIPTPADDIPNTAVSHTNPFQFRLKLAHVLRNMMIGNSSTLTTENFPGSLYQETKSARLSRIQEAFSKFMHEIYGYAKPLYIADNSPPNSPRK